MKTIFLIEDDRIMSECIARAIRKSQSEPVELYTFTNGITAIQALNNKLPDLICLDILLSGPDGFSLLNELTSYNDTAKIPVIIISSLDLSRQDLSCYNVKTILQKETMTPSSISEAVMEVLDRAE